MGWPKCFEDNMECVTERLRDRDVAGYAVTRSSKPAESSGPVYITECSFPKATRKPAPIPAGRRRVTGDVSGEYKIVQYDWQPLKKQHKFGKPACIVGTQGWDRYYIPVRIDPQRRMLFIFSKTYAKYRVAKMAVLEIRSQAA